jgi:hypothetical protein
LFRRGEGAGGPTDDPQQHGADGINHQTNETFITLFRLGKEKEVLQTSISNLEQREDTGPKVQQLQQEMVRLKVFI